MNRYTIYIKKIEEISFLPYLLKFINNPKIEISNINKDKYKSINKIDFIKLFKDFEDWMSFDKIRLYSSNKLIFECILHEFELIIYDSAVYKKVKQLLKIETLVKDLKKLKEKINLFMNKEIPTEEFDKWIVSQILRDDTLDFYKEIVSEIGTKLELLRVEFLDSIKWRKTNKDKTNYKEITYSKEYLESILNKIDNKIKEIK